MNRDLFAASGVGGGVVEATTDPYFNSTTLLLSGDGTNGAQNNTFIDSSVNTAAITRSGTPTQGSFSPFSQTGWSGYFNGTTDYLTTPSSANTAFSSSTTFTIDVWVYPTAYALGAGYDSARTIMSTAYTYPEGWRLDITTTSVTWYTYTNSSAITTTLILNKWTHLAVTHDGTTTKLYKDGILVGSAATTWSAGVSSPFYIGALNAGSYLYPYQGYISNLRITKGVAVYTGNFTPPTTPLTATQAAGTNIAAITGTATSLLTLQDNRFKDNSTNNFTVSVGSGTPSVQAFSPFAPTAAYSLPAAAAGSAYFNGSSYISVPDNVASAIGTANFTIEFWFYNTDLVNQPIFSLGSYATGIDFRISEPSASTLGAYFYGVSKYAAFSTTNIWQHVAIVRSSGVSTIYLNGAVFITGFADTSNYTTTSVRIGSMQTGSTTRSGFLGYISNVRIVKGTAVYTGAFTPPSAPLTKIQSAGSNIAEITSTATPNVDLLIVAGGGSGGGGGNQAGGGGGGAGGVIPISGRSVLPGVTYTVTVGAGAVAVTQGSGVKGGNSAFDTTIAEGGGYGGGWDYASSTGGSGGGAGYGNVQAASASNAVAPQLGNGGGAGISAGGYPGGGGGGAGAAGGSAPNNVTGGTGGIGYQSSISGTATYYGGGGGAGNWGGTAGTGGTGGGGTGSTSANGSNGTANTGGGGGGSTANIARGTGGAGGSGVVIIRHADTYATATTTGTVSVTTSGGYKMYSFTTSGSITFSDPTTLLTLQDSTFKDNSANVATITATSPAPVIKSFTPFTQVWGGLFNGSSDYLTVPDNAIFQLGSNDFTIEAWVYIVGNVGSTRIIVGKEGGSTSDCYLFLITSGGQIGVNLSSDGGTYGTTIVSTTVIALNTWNHVVVTRSGSATNNIKIYLNGVQDGQGTFSGTIYPLASTLTIGYRNSASPLPFNGYISNLRIVKGTAVYTGAFTPPAKTLSATQAAGTNISAIYPGQTSLLTLQDPTFKDNAILPNTITATGTPKAQLVSAPFTSAATVDPVSGSAYFNGTTDWLSTPQSSNFTFDANFTIEFWLYISSNQTADLLGTSNNTTYIGNAGWVVAYYTGSGIRFSYQSSNSWVFETTLNITPSLNSWNHVAIVRNGSTITGYLNGVAGSSTGTSSATLTSNLYGAYIGSGAGNQSFKLGGYISNLRVVKGVAVYTGAFTPPTAPLTATQSAGTNIAAITGTATSLLTLQDSTFKDNSANVATITASGTPSMRAFTPFASNWGGLFAGASTYLTPSNIPIASTGAFTIEFWMYSTSSSLQCIYSQYLAGTADTGRMHLLFNDPASKISISTGASVGNGTLISTSSPPLNTWMHIAIVRDSSNVAKMYINGVLDATNATFTTTIMQTPAYIGYTQASPGYGFNGYISNFRITNTTVYTGAFTPPSAPLTAITNTSLLTLQNNTFIDNSANAFAITATGSPKTQLLQLPFTSPITKVAAPWNISVTAPLATVGGSMYFNGTSDYTSATLASAIGTGDYTIELWYYPLSGTNSGLFQLSGTSGGFYTSAANSLAMNLYLSNSLSVYVGNYSYSTANNKVLYNVWTHIALVRSTGVTKLYLNGVLETSIFTSGSLADTVNYTGTYGVIGGYYSTGYLSNAYISNLRVIKGTAVYTGNFTPPAAPPQPNQTPGLLGTNVNAVDGTNTSLLLLGSNAGIYDATAKNDIVTVGDTRVSSTQIKYGTGAMYFDGTGDYLSIPTNPSFNFGSGAFTIEAWINRSVVGDTYFITSASGIPGMFFGFQGGSLLGYGRVSTAWDYTAAHGMTTNAWYHVALTRGTDNNIRMFVNGSQIGTTQNSAQTYDLSLTSLTIGTQGSLYPFNGYIDDLRITKGIARYTTAFTPPTKAMIGQ
jgi:hypothetical protein